MILQLPDLILPVHPVDPLILLALETITSYDN